jgi:hypothetical protein
MNLCFGLEECYMNSDISVDEKFIRILKWAGNIIHMIEILPA